MKELFTSIYLCTITALILVACDPRTLGGASCTSEGSYGAQFVTEVTALDVNSFHIKAEFLLRNAQAPKYFTPLTFLDGKQYAYQEPVLIDCGETHTWDYEVHGDEPDVHTVNVYAQPDLPVHPEFQKYTPETLPLEHADLWSIASNHDVISTTLFGDPPELTPTEIPYRRFERDGPTNGWLYLSDNHLRPDYLTTLEGNTLDFSIYFAEITQLNRAGVYTITCMVNDKQVPVFGDQLVWSAPIAQGEAVTIPAQVKITEPGWHQLNCTVLNSLYDKQGEVNEFPYTIDAMFVYKEP